MYSRPVVVTANIAVSQGKAPRGTELPLITSGFGTTGMPHVVGVGMESRGRVLEVVVGGFVGRLDLPLRNGLPLTITKKFFMAFCIKSFR